MKKQDYMKALEELKKGTTDLKIIKKALPYIPVKEIKQYLRSMETGKETIVCSPPIGVEGVAGFISFQPETIDEQTGEVFPQGAYSIGATEDNFLPYFDAAQKYSKNNWGADLKKKNWKDNIQFHFHNPKNLTPQKLPSCAGDVFVAINQEFRRLNLDMTKSLSELIDSSIVEITDNSLVGVELSVGSPIYSGMHSATRFVQCSLCGAPLGPNFCSFCKVKFNYDLENFSHIALPKKVSDYLIAKGWKFEIDPQVVRNRELESFEAEKGKKEYLQLLVQAKAELLGFDFEESLRPFYREESENQGIAIKDVLGKFLGGM